MKSFVSPFLLFNILMVSICASEQEKPNKANQTMHSQATKSVKKPNLREELLKRFNAACHIRADLIKKYNGSIPAIELASVNKIDDENTIWIKSATEMHGWLNTGLVGEDGEDAAFRIIRNATRNWEFQKRSPEHLRRALEMGGGSTEQIKTLTDRIDETAAVGQRPTSINNNSSRQTTNFRAVDPNIVIAQEEKKSALRQELLQRIKSDQATRIETIKNPPLGRKLPDKVLARFKAIDNRTRNR